MGSRKMEPEELEDHKRLNPKSKKTTIEAWPGQLATTYIEETRMEIELGRSLTSETTSHPTSWGQLVERMAFNLLGIDYILCSKDTIKHKTIPHYAGSPDCVKFDEGGTVVDLKSPFTLKSFITFARCKTITEVREKHDDGEKYYWQLLSNSILTDSKYCELIFFVPYQSQLQTIRDMASNVEIDQKRYAWIFFAEDNELPWLYEGGKYHNMYVIRWEAPKADKELLISRIKQANKLL